MVGHRNYLSLGKRKTSEKSFLREPKAAYSLHNVAVPDGYLPSADESIYGTLFEPKFFGKLARKYSRQTDPVDDPVVDISTSCLDISMSCLERSESLIVSTDSSDSKIAISDYCVSMGVREDLKVIICTSGEAAAMKKYTYLKTVFPDVGLITNEDLIHQEAICLVISIDTLRGMIYSGFDCKKIGWVIFEETNYISDYEKGYFLEEIIILMPPVIRMLLLSTPVSNVMDFAEWISRLRNQPCHAIHVPTTQKMDSKEVSSGEGVDLESTFRLCFYSILNLIRRADGQFTTEDVINNSFYQFRFRKVQPMIELSIGKLMEEFSELVASEEELVVQYDKLRLEIAELEDKLMFNIRDPERFIPRGCLVKVRDDDGTDYEWGVAVKIEITQELFDIVHMVDIFLHVSPRSADDKSPPNPCPPPVSGQKCEVDVVSVPLQQVRAISSLILKLPGDLNELHSNENREFIRAFLETARWRYYPKISLEKIGLEDPAFVSLVEQIEQLEKALLEHPLHKEYLNTPQSTERVERFQIKRGIFDEIEKLRYQLVGTQLEMLHASARQCSLVLEKLGHIKSDGSMELKGHAACLIDTGNELLVSEVMFDGTFNNLDPHQTASLASCLLPGDDSNKQEPSVDHLVELLEKVHICAQKINKIQQLSNFDVYGAVSQNLSVRPYMMDTIYMLSKEENVAEILEKTEGLQLVQVARKLVGFLTKLGNAAERAGFTDLQKNFLTARERMEQLNEFLAKQA